MEIPKPSLATQIRPSHIVHDHPYLSHLAAEFDVAFITIRAIVLFVRTFAFMYVVLVLFVVF